MYRYYDYECEDCKQPSLEMFTKDRAPNTIICKECFGNSHKKLAAPTVLRASFADGQKRGERWSMAKESAKMEQEAQKLRKQGDNKGAHELKQEARKVNKRASSKRDKTDK